MIEFGVLLTGWVELAVSDSVASTHVLEISRKYYRAISHTIPMFEFSRNNKGKGFRILMRMRSKAATRFYDVIVHHNQRVETAVFRMVLIGKRK